MENRYVRLYSEFEAKLLLDVDNALTKLGLWEWLAEFNPQQGDGFMFSHHPNLNAIISAITYQGHSGASFAWTMRTLQTLARLGWATFAEVVSTDSPACPCRRAKGYWAGRCGGGPGCDQ